MSKSKSKKSFKARFKEYVVHPAFFIPFGTISLILVLSLVVFHFAANTKQLKVVPDSKVVIVTHDGARQVVPTNEKTVGDLLGKLNITLNTGDTVEPDLVTPINQDDFRINIYRAKPVKIIDGSNSFYAFSAATTPRAIAAQSGVQLYPEDGAVSFPTQNILASGAIGAQIVVVRATPINLNLYGTQLAVRTQAKTVAEYIKQQNIRLGKNDQVVPTPNTPITENMQLSFISNGEKTVTVKEVIPTPINTVYDNTLAYGTSAVRQKGSPGERVVTYKQVLQNNVVVSQTVLQSVTTINPVTQIVVAGTSLSGIKGDMGLAGISPGDYTYADYIISHESGWCPTKAQGEHYCPAVPDNQFTPNGYGLCQATPGSKMSSAGSDWATNPITQLRWCSGYAVGRYGSWYNAYIHWINNGNW